MEQIKIYDEERIIQVTIIYLFPNAITLAKNWWWKQDNWEKHLIEVSIRIMVQELRPRNPFLINFINHATRM
jgi:hypothetical protein